MTHKIHFRATKNGYSACAVGALLPSGKFVVNHRQSYRDIPESHVVRPDEFRATAPEDRCAHCCDKFQSMLNARRIANGKPPYKNAWTKEI